MAAPFFSFPLDFKHAVLALILGLAGAYILAGVLMALTPVVLWIIFLPVWAAWELIKWIGNQIMNILGVTQTSR
jgi:hypothetical protein